MNDIKSSDATSSQEHIIDPFGATAHIEAGAGIVHSSDIGTANPGISKTVGFEISESRVD
jgi:hypothetical protein